MYRGGCLQVVLDLSSMEKRPYLSNDRDFVAAAIQRIFQVRWLTFTPGATTRSP
jgi:hypothetical protein